MSQTAAHLVDHVIQAVPVRQWVLSLPMGLRLLLAALTYRIAFGLRAGRKVVTLRGAQPREAAARQRLCAALDRFSLHGAVRCEAAHERQRLEHLCRYLTRPALSDERLKLDAAGQVVLELKTPWRDGTTHVVMSPHAARARRCSEQGCKRERSVSRRPKTGAARATLASQSILPRRSTGPSIGANRLISPLSVKRRAPGPPPGLPNLPDSA